MRARTDGATERHLREAKRRPGRIPTGLWGLGARAAAEHGDEETAKQLRGCAERLEQWVQRLEVEGPPAGSAATEFVVLLPLAGSTLGEYQVEVEEPSRRKLRISLRGSAVA